MEIDKEVRYKATALEQIYSLCNLEFVQDKCLKICDFLFFEREVGTLSHSHTLRTS